MSAGECRDHGGDCGTKDLLRRYIEERYSGYAQKKLFQKIFKCSGQDFILQYLETYISSARIRTKPKVLSDTDYETKLYECLSELNDASSNSLARSISEMLFKYITTSVSSAVPQIVQENEFPPFLVLFIINAAINCLKRDSMVLNLSGYTYVAGSLYGTLEKLLSVIRTTRLGSYPVGERLPFKILFTGNYVDLGEESFKTAFLIAVLKILFPDNIFLLRGLHEDRCVNGDFTSSGAYSLLLDCRNLFTEGVQMALTEYVSLVSVMGTSRRIPKGVLDKIRMSYDIVIWNSINDMFDYLPLVAIVNQINMVVHSGLPRWLAYSGLLMFIEMIEAIAPPLCNPLRYPQVLDFLRSTITHERLDNTPDKTLDKIFITRPYNTVEGTRGLLRKIKSFKFERLYFSSYRKPEDYNAPEHLATPVRLCSDVGSAHVEIERIEDRFQERIEYCSEILRSEYVVSETDQALPSCNENSALPIETPGKI